MMKEYKMNSTYPLLVEKVIGKKAKGAINLFFFLCLFGTMLAYGLVCNQFFCAVFEEPLRNAFSVTDKEWFHSVFSLSAFMFIAIISLPLMLMNDTSKFGSITFISLASLFFIMTLICIQAPAYQTSYNPTKTLNMFNNMDNPLLIIQNIGIFSFALYTLDVFFLVTNNLGKQATPKNIMSISTVSVNT